MKRLWALAISFTVLMSTVPGFALTLSQDGRAQAPVVRPDKPTLPEQTAAAELVRYLGLVTGGEVQLVGESQAGAKGIYVGATRFAAANGVDVTKLAEEEWVIRTVDGGLILAGGGARGTLYATYRFLEETVGVHWWNPWEESVPEIPSLAVEDLDQTGKPVLRYRDIYMLYGNDRGRFAARNRLNRDGDAGIGKDYGGCMDYGPPYHVHTFYKYFPPGEHFATHPEWYSLIDGERSADRKQLCLTNPQVREGFVRKLRAYIDSARARAAKEGVPAPVVFDISQNDWRGACQCDDCQAIVKREESEAGVLIDFLNYISDAISEDYPDIYIDTLAYQYTQKPPKSIKPRDNIIFRLCDTGSNFTQPITAPINTEFREFLLSWAKIAKNLRIWDYAVTYAPPRGFPFPSVHTYAPDFSFYAENHVEGVFTEHEYPIIGDMHDLKAWMMMKLKEDPYRDYGELLKTFTDGFYGTAGLHIRRYLSRLQEAAQKSGSHVGMGTGPSGFGYLTLDFMVQAHRIFDDAERALRAESDDPTLFARVRHARLSLDRAAMVLGRRLMSEWVARGNEPEAMPLKRDVIAGRVKETWYAEIDRRIPASRRAAERAKADSEITKYTSLPVFVALPAKFADAPAGTVVDFTADMSRNWRDIVKVVKDEGAESGITNRLTFPDGLAAKDHPLDKYKLPMPWGLYAPATKAFVTSSSITAADVPGSGYHWYKMGTHKIGPSYYLYFFWSWIIQIDLGSAFDEANPDQQFDIWASVKFEGPAFGQGDADDENALCVERVVLVKAD